MIFSLSSLSPSLPLSLHLSSPPSLPVSFSLSPTLQFAVNYKARNNSDVNRDEIIKLVAGMVVKNGDFDHQVDLNNPDLTIVVEIIKVHTLLGSNYYYLKGGRGAQEADSPPPSLKYCYQSNFLKQSRMSSPAPPKINNLKSLCSSQLFVCFSCEV